MLRRAVAVATTLLLCVSSAVAAPVPKSVKKKPQSLDGTWEVVEYFSSGNKVNSTLTTRWVIDGQTLSIERVNKGGGAIAKVATTVSYSLVKPDGGPPNALNYTLTYNNAAIAPRSMPGVYEFDGDTLKFCWTSAANGERPTECVPAQGNLLYVFKRVSDTK